MLPINQTLGGFPLRVFLFYPTKKNGVQPLDTILLIPYGEGEPTQ
jgi:hypothetical protein